MSPPTGNNCSYAIAAVHLKMKKHLFKHNVCFSCTRNYIKIGILCLQIEKQSMKNGEYFKILSVILKRKTKNFVGFAEKREENESRN